MSELESFSIKEAEEGCPFWEAEYEVYSKIEVDKVIAHHKYKRSLAMAKMCDSEENRLEAISPIFDTNKECWEYNSDYWARWQKHWLEIAEKFKEAK